MKFFHYYDSQGRFVGQLEAKSMAEALALAKTFINAPMVLDPDEASRQQRENPTYNVHGKAAGR